MLLDARYDPSLSCLAIASDTALQAFFGFLFLFTFGAVGVGAQYYAAADRVAWLNKHLRPLSLMLLGFLPLACVSLFLFAFGDEKRKELFIEGENLVETGCLRLTEYRYEFPVKRVAVLYEHDDYKGGHDYLKIIAGFRNLYVDLRGADQWQNLSIFAPASMKKYAAYLRQNDRVVPPEIADIP